LVQSSCNAKFLPLDGFQFTLNYRSNYINAFGAPKYLTRGFVRVEETLDLGKRDFKVLVKVGAVSIHFLGKYYTVRNLIIYFLNQILLE
jgi:hypothetical protein